MLLFCTKFNPVHSHVQFDASSLVLSMLERPSKDIVIDVGVDKRPADYKVITPRLLINTMTSLI